VRAQLWPSDPGNVVVPVAATRFTAPLRTVHTERAALHASNGERSPPWCSFTPACWTSHRTTTFAGAVRFANAYERLAEPKGGHPRMPLGAISAYAMHMAGPPCEAFASHISSAEIRLHHFNHRPRHGRLQIIA